MRASIKPAYENKWSRKYMCVYIKKYGYLCVCYMYMHVYQCVYLYVYMNVCVYINPYTYIFTHMDILTNIYIFIYKTNTQTSCLWQWANLNPLFPSWKNEDPCLFPTSLRWTTSVGQGCSGVTLLSSIALGAYVTPGTDGLCGTARLGLAGAEHQRVLRRAG